MRLELLAKDPQSGKNGCPSVHVDADDGTFVVQGTHVPNSELPSYLPDEGGVKIDPQILVAAMKIAKERGLL
ncbi:hypothetical protein ACFWMR_02330 [Amycolatopsis thailandensis]|uniref:hypothetical protein n=1 Tax=Amycolatopsis thailandensis TaxID=589330 RepID=UPI0036480C41